MYHTIDDVENLPIGNLGTPGVSSHLGDEIDFTLKWQRNRMHTVSLGVAFFIPGDFIKETGESPDATFFYLQTRVHF